MADERPAPPSPRFTVGLDLGQAQDFTALAVIKTTPHGHVVEGKPPANRHDVVYLRRYELGTSYPAIVASVVELVAKPGLRPDLKSPPPVLGIDATGVGGAVVDLFLLERMAARACPVKITAGDLPRWDGLTAYVPKLDLVGELQARLGSEQLKVVPGLSHADTLKREMLSFQVKVTAHANEQFGAWREGVHDDLVLAVAIALWLAERNVGVMATLGKPVSARVERPADLIRRDPMRSLRPGSRP